ncbi:J domain-containing protein [Sphingomonas sp. Mn802worker]|uniref:J domain-containing protein n=1 Tax=Sphingomonas sp. Mn802worker TaxID=629773 RepID=UPI00035EF7A2|nr:J domain-containing protein [Sphingomonas sp. Mn802worker]
MDRDPYQILGVARTASQTEIRARYVRLLKLHHPDIEGSLPARLADVQAAYRCLADPAIRAAHDRRLADRERSHFERQRRVQRRLGRYDRGHRHSIPRACQLRRWRTVLIATIGIGVATRAALMLF